MFRPDAGNFNRFLTSLGLALLAGALVVPYLYFKNTGTLEIPQGEMREMTPTGSDAIRARQHAIVSLEPWVIGLAGGSAALGLVLVVIGGARLKRAQKSEDEEGRLRRDRVRMEMREMSPSERAADLTEKAKAENERLRVVAASPADSSVEPERGRSSPVMPMKTRQETIARALNRFEKVFSRDEPTSHRLKLQLSLRSMTDAIRVDGLFEALESKAGDVLLDLQVSNPRFIDKSVRNRADGLIAKLSRYTNMSQRKAQGWLVIVIPEELESEARADELEAAEKRLQESLSGFGAATVVVEKSMDLLPDLFRFEFGARSVSDEKV